MDARSSIQLTHISKSFERPDGSTISVLREVSLDLVGPTFATIVGPNGCGKTTLLNIVAGSSPPDSGRFEVQTCSGVKARIGYVWQNYRESLLPWLDVGDNIGFPLKTRGVPIAERRRVSRDLLRQFAGGIRSDQRVYQLSGGQQQLICILRAVAAQPDILLLDEPFSALDQQTRWAMGFQVERIWLERPLPVLFVSHDVDEAVLFADEIYLLSKRTGAFARIVRNRLPRPRSAEMLRSEHHIRARDEIIDFLFQEKALSLAD